MKALREQALTALPIEQPYRSESRNHAVAVDDQEIILAREQVPGVSVATSRVGKSSTDSPRACNCAANQNMATSVLAPIDSSCVGSSRKM